MISYKEKIAEILAPHVDGLEKNEILDMLETPADSKMGDYAFPCFKLAKISSAEASRRSGVRPTRMRLAPAWSRAWAIYLPSPEPAPVTSAVWPWSEKRCV